ncbi:MAG TPA: 2-(1,2-epoxy-1,2-dihydrophenyl)acetyl-CoA isomerase, partial [Rhodospirillaceae bacterium]|nr:2-(1,2-epoxy-1,2-dihydrophenyl)acetyl-CoA isomerase [Rhodospirillaceae bacterium]
MAYNCILNRIEDGVSVITFNRPEKLCAMNAEMMGETTDAIDKAVADENVRCILLTGTGRGFCSGQDLNDRIQAEDGQKRDLGVTLDQGYNRFARKIHTLRMPMVVAVNGIAAGAGASIALLG